MMSSPTHAAIVALLAAHTLIACGDALPTAGGDEGGPYCEKGQRFEYIDNGTLSFGSSLAEMEVGGFSEIVVYLESPGSECAGPNSSETVDLFFRADDESPWGTTGQSFDFEYTGGRFRVDGRYMRMEARCDGSFSFNYQVSGVACVE